MFNSISPQKWPGMDRLILEANEKNSRLVISHPFNRRAMKIELTIESMFFRFITSWTKKNVTLIKSK